MKRLVIVAALMLLMSVTYGHADVIRLDWSGRVLLNPSPYANLGAIGDPISGFVTYENSVPITPSVLEYQGAIGDWRVGALGRADFFDGLPPSVDVIKIENDIAGGFGRFDRVQLPTHRPTQRVRSRVHSHSS